MLIPTKFRHILITGGAGFIGSHMVDELLAAGKNVRVFDNLTSGKQEFINHHIGNPHFKLIKGDLLNKDDLQKAFEGKIDTVIHLAANPDISKGIKDPTLDFNQTIIATFNLILKMREKKIKKLIYFSGSGVYGDLGEEFVSEKFGPLLPISMYGASKLSAEALISAFSHLFHIQAWIFRPANIVGDRATHGVIFDFINKLKKNPKQLTILGDGKQSKAYLFINDVLNAVWMALRVTNNQINLFNIASRSFITVDEIAKISIQTLGLKDVKITHTGGKVGWPGDVPIVRIENKKLNALGWEAKFSSFEAIQKTAEALKNNFI